MKKTILRVIVLMKGQSQETKEAILTQVKSGLQKLNQIVGYECANDSCIVIVQSEQQRDIAEQQLDKIMLDHNEQLIVLIGRDDEPLMDIPSLYKYSHKKGITLAESSQNGLRTNVYARIKPERRDEYFEELKTSVIGTHLHMLNEAIAAMLCNDAAHAAKT